MGGREQNEKKKTGMITDEKSVLAHSVLYVNMNLLVKSSSKSFF